MSIVVLGSSYCFAAWIFMWNLRLILVIHLLLHMNKAPASILLSIILLFTFRIHQNLFPVNFHRDLSMKSTHMIIIFYVNEWTMCLCTVLKVKKGNIMCRSYQIIYLQFNNPQHHQKWLSRGDIAILFPCLLWI